MPTINLDTQDHATFDHAVRCLSSFAQGGRAIRTQNFSVAIAALIFRAVPGRPTGRVPPRIFTPDLGPPLSTGDFQHQVCDGLFAKDSGFLPSGAEGPIYKPFTDSFKASTRNNWRNSFDLQAGIACDAPYSESFLKSRVFLAEERFDCEYRNNASGQCRSPAGLTSQARTCFNPNKKANPPGPGSDAKKTAKLLTRGIDSDQNEGYWIVEPSSEVLIDLLGSADTRVPLYPFLAAVYSGSLLFGRFGRYVDRAQFQADLKLGDSDFVSIFDPDPTSLLNKDFLAQASTRVPIRGRRDGSSDSGRPDGVRRDRDSKSSPFRPGRDVGEFIVRAEDAADPAQRVRLLEKASRGHARALDALGNLLVAQRLRPREQIGGYDLFVEASGVGHLFEIKTWREENLAAQVRTGIAQLYEYRWRNRSDFPTDTRLYLVLDRRPPVLAMPWLWQFLFEDRQIIPCWMEGQRLTTFYDYTSTLSWIPL